MSKLGLCHGHTNRELHQSTDDAATTDKVMNVGLKVTRLGTLEVVSDKTTNLGSYD